MVHITVSSRLCVRGALPEDVQAELRAAFSHKNPEYGKLKRINKRAAYRVPTHIATWREKNGALLLPRGGTERLRDVLRDNDLRGEVLDARTEGRADWRDRFPSHKVALWRHQGEIIEACKRFENCLVRAPTGCITGDAKIGINRAGKGRQVTLRHLVKMHNGGRASNRTWRADIPTMVRSRMKDGTVRLVRLIGAYESGIKPVYEVKFETGHAVRATLDHRFWTIEGWRRLGEMSVGDEVFVEESRKPRQDGERKSKPWYELRVARYHPHAGRKGVKPGKGGYTVPLHRLVAEAALNGISTQELIRRCNQSQERANHLTLLDPRVHVVHHIDENPRNNCLDNLAIVTHAEHRSAHAHTSRVNITVRTAPSKVIAIAYAGERLTYDLELEAPHNFLANGVAVHNSGKTTAVIGLLVELQLPTLVIVWTGSLLKQWVKRLKKELGLDDRDIGVIGGGKKTLRPITVAMQQSLNRMKADKWIEVDETFGVVVCDEVHRFAASTFQKTIDRCTARYRVGISADETRNDGKEFLVYDMFGNVVADIDEERLIARGLIHDVKVRVVPTDFEAGWYVDQRRAMSEWLRDKEGKQPPAPDFNRLLDEMTVNDKRNDAAMRLVLDEWSRGQKSIAFSHRREHCERLLSKATANGMPAGVLLGGDEDEDTFDETVEMLERGELSFAAGTMGAIGTGLDLPSVARGVVATPITSNRQFWGQVRGRLCRKAEGKTDALVYYLWDRNVFGASVLDNLRRWNRDVKVLDDSGRWVETKQYIKENC